MGNLSSKKINQRQIRLKILLLKSGLNNKDVAEKTDYTDAMVSQYIKGIRGSKRLDEYFQKLKEN